MNKFEGYGTYYYDNGDIFQGYWQEGLQIGKGVYYLKSG